MHLAGCGWSQIDDFAGVFVDQEQVLVRMRFLLAAIVLLLLGGVGWALATALRAVDGQIRGTLKRQGTGSDPAGVTLRRHAKRGQGALQDGQHVMNPVVGLGLAQLEL